MCTGEKKGCYGDQRTCKPYQHTSAYTLEKCMQHSSLVNQSLWSRSDACFFKRPASWSTREKCFHSPLPRQTLVLSFSDRTSHWSNICSRRQCAIHYLKWLKVNLWQILSTMALEKEEVRQRQKKPHCWQAYPPKMITQGKHSSFQIQIDWRTYNLSEQDSTAHYFTEKKPKSSI